MGVASSPEDPDSKLRYTGSSAGSLYKERVRCPAGEPIKPCESNSRRRKRSKPTNLTSVSMDDQKKPHFLCQPAVWQDLVSIQRPREIDSSAIRSVQEYIYNSRHTACDGPALGKLSVALSKGTSGPFLKHMIEKDGVKGLLLMACR